MAMKLSSRIRLAILAGVALCFSAGGATQAFGQQVLTQDGGQPVGDNQNSRTAGENGSVLLDNFQLIQKLARFDRERVPERVVHARGVGAFGKFVSYGDYSKWTKATVFSNKGKETPVFVRFSTVIHGKGSPDQLRDPRGFAVKFYSDQGNWDLVGNNMPVFFIRDAIKFPDFVHSFKPSPITNQQDPNRQFDFLSHVPESTNMLTTLFSDQGTPANLRQMDGFGVHAFKFVNAKGEVRYVKFNWRSMQGHKYFSSKDAQASAGKNHSAHQVDLYKEIAKGNFPSWELGVQILRPDQLDDFDYNPLDATKIWPNVPEVKIGKMTLNRTPDNYFQSTEQSAFSPGMVIPGIEPSEDRLLQGRLFSYADTQRYRIGANYLALPVNRPKVKVKNINQDGQQNFLMTKSDVNYQPSRSADGLLEKPSVKSSRAKLAPFVTQARIKKTDDFAQAGTLYRSYSDSEKAALIKNFSGDLKKVKNQQIRLRILSFLYQADKDYGTRMAKSVGESIGNVKKMIEVNQGVDPIHWKEISLDSGTTKKAPSLDDATKKKLIALAFDAARKNDAETVEQVLKAGIDVNSLNSRGDSLLIVSAYRGSEKVVSLVLGDPKVRLEQKNRMGLTAVSAAAFRGHEKILQQLVKAGCKVDSSNSVGQTPIMFAALTGRTGAVKILKKAGADPLRKDRSGNNAVSLAKQQGATDVLKVLE